MTTTTFHFESFEAFSPFSDVGPYRAADLWTLSLVVIEITEFRHEVDRQMAND